MGEHFQPGDLIATLSSDIELFTGEDTTGASLLIKSVANPAEKLRNLLKRENETNNFSGIHQVLLPRAIIEEKQLTYSVYEVPEELISFRQALSAADDLPQKLKLALDLASFIAELHNNNLVCGVLEPDSLFYLPQQQTISTVNCWNIVCDGEYTEAVISDLQEFANLLAVSPEATGRTGRRPDKSSDLYCLGVLLYKVFTGVYPFESEDPVSLVHAHIAKVPEFDPGLAWAIPEVILSIIERLLHKEPEQRYPDIASLLKDLQECVSQYQNTGIIRTFPIARRIENQHITFPEFLYGREAEVAHINKLFLCFLESGDTQLTAIYGPSGIGKTALVNELRLPATERGSLFVLARCEQFNTSANYSALLQAIRSLLEQYLLMDEDTLSQLRADLNTLSSSHLNRLIPLLPELNTILGRSLSSDGQRAEKLEKSFYELLEILTRQGRSIVLVLDDMQWVDKLSLDIIAHFISQNKLPRLFVTILYRDVEVTSDHPLNDLLRQVRATNYNIEFIQLAPLSEQSTQDFVEDTFWETDFDLEDLGQIVIEKTQGNPFFVKEFLQNIAAEKYLFENEEHVWSWQEEKIRATKVTENVIDFIAVRLSRLTEQETECLKFAAWLDEQIDISLLQNLVQWPAEQLQARLQSWVMEGVLVSVVDNSKQTQYYFSHNKVKQAARELSVGVSDDDICYRIAKTLMESKDQQWLKHHALELVQYLHAGLQYHKNEHQAEELAGYYLLAGNAARIRLSKDVALEYFRTGVALLNQRAWQEHYELAFALHEGLAECLCDCDFEQEFADVLELMQRQALSALHLSKVIKLRVKLAIFLEQLQKAHEICLDFIQHRYPELLLPESLQEYLDIQEQLMQSSIPEACSLQKTRDPDVLLLQELIAEVIPTAKSLGNIPWYQVLYCNLWLSQKSGHCGASSRGYANHALVLAGIPNKISEALKFIEFAEHCNDVFGATLQIASELNFIKYAAIWPWIRPLETSIQPLYDNYLLGSEQNFVEFTYESMLTGSVYRLLNGMPLQQVQDMFAQQELELREKEQIFHYGHLSIWQQLVDNLTEKTPLPSQFNGKFFNESFDLPRLLATNSCEAIFNWHFCRLQLCFYFDDYTEGQKHWLSGKQLLHRIPPYYHISDFFLFGALVLVRLVPEADSDALRQELLADIEEIVAQLHYWKSLCPVNQEVKLTILEAELDVLRNNDSAWKRYVKAVTHAAQIQDCKWLAVAHECFANYWLINQEVTLAETHFQKAITAWREWQAHNKVAHLSSRLLHHNINFSLEASNPLTTQSTSSVSEKKLDLLSVLKAAETLSGSIDLDAFLHRMMNIIAENAGAQRGCILFKEEGATQQEDEFRIRASYPTSMSMEQIPESLLNYVIRIKEVYVVHDSAAEAKLSLRPQSFGRLPQSLLIMPLIVASNLRGLLYLEHRNLKGFFTDDRIDVLQLLANQTAILFDNANLNQRLMLNNRNLEIKVEQRTEELARAKLKAEEATAAKSNFLANMSHEIRTPMNAVIGLSRLALRKQTQPEHRDYLEKILSSSESLLTLINDILDFSKVEAQKLTLEAIPFSLEESVRRVVNLNNHKMHEKHLEFVLSVDSSIPDSLIGDPLRIEQIIINLVSNAIKFTDEGYVHLNLALLEKSSDKLTLEIRVKDSGIGMSQEQSDKLFHSFSQADNSVTRKYGGTGLGLAICKQLCDLMQGTISVFSREDEGSEFIVTLVLQESSEPIPKSDALDVTNLRVLVVDDVEIARNVMCDTLDALGIKADAVAGGKEALKQVTWAERQEQAYNIILMDWKMPEMDGIEASRQIREIVKGNIPHILMVTAYDKEEIKAADYSDVVDRYIEKPVSQSALIAAIHSALGLNKNPVRDVFATGEVPDLSGTRILLVEDNELNQQVAMEFLMETGATIEVATDGIKALSAAQNSSFDLILMDIQMPEMDGLQATTAIRQFDRTTPIVAMTAHAMESDRERSLAVGMNGHITKPIEPAKLYTIICSFVFEGVEKMPQKSQSMTADPAQEGATSFGIQVLKQINILSVDRAIERFQGRSNLYLDLVDDFVVEYKDVVQQLQTALAEGTDEYFYRRIHSLKSNAAYIGAFELSKQLAEVEERINQQKPFQDLLAQVMAEIEDLIRQLSEKQALRQKRDADMTSNTSSSCHDISLLVSLLPLLENSDFRVEAKIANLMGSQQSAEVLDMLAKLENMVDEMEFEEATEYLRTWLSLYSQHTHATQGN